MTITKQVTASIHVCFPEVNDFLVAQREGLYESASLLRPGINISIILNSACYVEGALEAGLKALMHQRRGIYGQLNIPDFYTRKTLNGLFYRLADELETRISRDTGPERFDGLFEMILGEPISSLDSIEPVWEGIVVLFQFRNMIAHARAIFASFTLHADGTYRDASFRGGYRKAEEYLLKKKLIEHHFGEGDFEDFYFTDDVADHFWALSQDFVKRVSESLAGAEKISFDSGVWPVDDGTSDPSSDL